MNQNSVTIPTSSPICAEITPPGSKSITNRALAIAAAAEGESLLYGVLDSEDTQMMMDSLRRMNVELEHDPEKKVIRLKGSGGIFQPVSRNSECSAGTISDSACQPESETVSDTVSGTVSDISHGVSDSIQDGAAEPSSGSDFLNLFCGNSGTTIRFLTAMCAAAQGNFRLDGVERMRQRPLGDLIHGLRQLGVSIESEFQNDCPPVLLRANGIQGGKAVIPGNISSQFLSGLLMAVPYAKEETVISVTGGLVSRPYIDMTISVMKAFGAEVTEPEKDTFRVAPNQRYRGTEYVVEPDASAASYFFAAAAVAGGEITVKNLSKNALQGDVGFCECLAKMGCTVEYLPNAIRVKRDPDAPLHGIDTDMHFISDTAQTLAVTALFADSPTTIRNVANMRVKETDRIHAVVTELRKFGVQAEEFEDGMTIHPLASLTAPIPESIEIETYRDHRMAMSFAVAGLRIPGVTILDPGCTVKTYPEFFKDLERVTQREF